MSQESTNEGWFETFSCGHQLAIKPLSEISFTNSNDKTTEPPMTRSGLMIQKNGLLQLAEPQQTLTVFFGHYLLSKGLNLNIPIDEFVDFGLIMG
jgi:hypothetical protein